MASVRIFLSFEFDKDMKLKNNFYAEAKQHSPHKIVNRSLREAYPTHEWQGKARAAISESDVVIVLVGQDTHNAPGVDTEIKIARRLGKPVFQIRSDKNRDYNGVRSLDEPIRWRWKRINAKIDELVV